ncbi:DUF4307 domain-containing protein [Tessaracoccus massiliensis]|uniref:DUF4307 domain-containing protein n=1 Tax=Tessaracoccus massiliensis TaxID=1522311 RepID=UPI00058C6723|nr:DUF4307 domain-containing protein [Tessaracoccus massiliensis]
MTTDEARIKARYPKASPADYLLGGLAAVAVLTAIVLVIISGLRNSNPDVVAMIRGFEVPSATEITAELVVQRKDPTQAAECRMYAQAESYETVAERIVEVPPGTEELTTMDVSLKTTKEATAIRIDGCRLAG